MTDLKWDGDNLGMRTLVLCCHYYMENEQETAEADKRNLEEEFSDCPLFHCRIAIKSHKPNFVF